MQSPYHVVNTNAVAKLCLAIRIVSSTQWNPGIKIHAADLKNGTEDSSLVHLI
jgi:hypothetical protein